MISDFDLQEIKERASHKAFAKLQILYIERDNLEDDIKSGNESIVPVETLKSMYNSTLKEIKVWSYIAKLIETDEI
jgi:hypothetical protein